MKGLMYKLIPFLVILSILLSACSTQTTIAPSTTSAPSDTPAPTQVPAASATSAPSDTPAPSTVDLPSPTPQPSPTTPPELSDDVWDRITANKKIVIGTSWDYPPFASIDGNFQIAGFDIALIQEIGNRLHIPVDIQNFSFEGLQGALQVNQIDLAVAAISMTPERSSQMSFSPTYYVNQTAILARGDSQIPAITAVNQLASYRVGVQRGTTYENWIKTNLVDKNLMPADKLFRYEQSDEAVRDLEENRIDVVVQGFATASYYRATKGMRVIGRGFDLQNLAVAMRLATPRLKSTIDKIISDMLTDGTILRLHQQFIDFDVSGAIPSPVPPERATPTPVPTPTPAPEACVDAMKFVADVTFDDGNMKTPPLIKPNEGFVKIWKLQNTGTCTWTPNYRLVYAYGNVNTADMGGKPAQVPGTIRPGQMVDIAVSLVAPQVPYTYQGFWQMENAKGEPFGQIIWVGITTDENANSGSPTGRYCEVTKLSPDKALNPREDFDAVWMVKNVSGNDWNRESVDYKFISGVAMHKKDSYDLTVTIADGNESKIIVDMLAPDKTGTYTARWAIVQSDKTLCNLSVTVQVK